MVVRDISNNIIRLNQFNIVFLSLCASCVTPSFSSSSFFLIISIDFIYNCHLILFSPSTKTHFLFLFLFLFLFYIFPSIFVLSNTLFSVVLKIQPALRRPTKKFFLLACPRLPFFFTVLLESLLSESDHLTILSPFSLSSTKRW